MLPLSKRLAAGRVYATRFLGIAAESWIPRTSRGMTSLNVRAFRPTALEWMAGSSPAMTRGGECS